MRHGRMSQRFNRPTDHRLAMFRNLVTELLKHEQIKTTEAKAKAIRPLAEKMITLGKDGTLTARRRVLPRLRGGEQLARTVRRALDRG